MIKEKKKRSEVNINKKKKAEFKKATTEKEYELMLMQYLEEEFK